MTLQQTMVPSAGHLSVSGVAQITTEGRSLQQKNARISMVDLWEQNAAARARLEREWPVHAAYLHVPFCFHKCHYCDFYSIVDSPAHDRREAFVDRLIGEIRTARTGWIRGEQAWSPLLTTQKMHTIFVGGGTPTLLLPAQWQRLLEAINLWLQLEPGGEFTVEANPETVTPELAAVLAAGGVNRVSIGAQSFNAQHLKSLERWHDPRNVERSVGILRDAGIANINLDLIFAVPGQTLDDWQADLQAALALEPAHISCYGLMYEPNTPMTRRMQMGKVQRVDDDVEAAMYEATIDRLTAAGFEQYEISNWARRAAGQAPARSEGYRCRHNLHYWRNANWWAFGPSASGHVNGLRWKNVPRLGDYLDDGDGTGWPPVTDVEIVDDATAAGEQFMLGLRLMEGLALESVDRLLAQSGEREQARRAAIEKHRQAGLLEVVDGHVRLTRRGLLLANAVLVDLV